jgi:hypothetical protein
MGLPSDMAVESMDEYMKGSLDFGVTVFEEAQCQQDNAGIVMHDKFGNPIKEGQRFTFDFIKFKEPIEFIGSFDWHSDDLRYEIDIWDNLEYVCLSYDPMLMKNFKLI